MMVLGLVSVMGWLVEGGLLGGPGEGVPDKRGPSMLGFQGVRGKKDFLYDMAEYKRGPTMLGFQGVRGKPSLPTYYSLLKTQQCLNLTSVPQFCIIYINECVSVCTRWIQKL
jgi:hypothetical protein